MAYGIYCTTYCNKGHMVSSGRPVGHECRVLLPSALQAEMDGDYETACAILAAQRHVKYVVGRVCGPATDSDAR